MKVPLPPLTSLQAVCCTDGNHCCPTHYKCDESRTSCIKEEVVIPWYTKIPAITTVQAEPSAVQSEESHCPDRSSCCQLFTGELGCCPMENVSSVCVFLRV